MIGKSPFKIVMILFVLIFVQAACALPGSTSSQDRPDNASGAAGDTELQPTQIQIPAGDDVAQPTEAPVQAAVPAGPPTPTPFIYKGASPATGTGGVYGRLLWNGKPVEGIQIKLCEEIKFFGGCQGSEYPAVTDSYGVYAILNVPPREYGLTYRALDADNWYYVTSGVLNAKDFEVPADQMVNVGDHNTVRVDVNITSPKEDDRLTIARPTLTWDPYPEAAYYELSFLSGRGGVMVGSKKLTTTTYTLDRDLQTCDYSFSIEVYNAQEIMIAENDGWRNFKVAGLPQTCVLTALTPADGASVKANAITLTWQPHDWAAVYKLHMYSESDMNVKILDFVKTNTASYTVTQTVPPGEYVWVVYAYDEFDEDLGFTDQFTLYVTNP